MKELACSDCKRHAEFNLLIYRKIIRAGAVFSLFLASAVAASVEAARADAGGIVSEIKLGGGVHDMPFLWSHFRRERGLDGTAAIMFKPIWQDVLGGNIRPVVGGGYSFSGQTSKVYADAYWEREWASGLFFGLGLGVAVHNGNLDHSDWENRKALGSQALFHIPIELGYRFDGHNSLSIYFDHMSNGYTQDYNEGMDHLGVRYGYKF